MNNDDTAGRRARLRALRERYEPPSQQQPGPVAAPITPADRAAFTPTPGGRRDQAGPGQGGERGHLLQRLVQFLRKSRRATSRFPVSRLENSGSSKPCACWKRAPEPPRVAQVSGFSGCSGFLRKMFLANRWWPATISGVCNSCWSGPASHYRHRVIQRLSGRLAQVNSNT